MDYINDRVTKDWADITQPIFPVVQLAASLGTGYVTTDPSCFVVSFVGGQTLANLAGGEFKIEIPFPIALLHVESVAALMAKLRIAAEQMDLWPTLETLTEEAYNADRLVHDVNGSAGLECPQCSGKATFELGHLVRVEHTAECTLRDEEIEV